MQPDLENSSGFKEYFEVQTSDINPNKLLQVV
jgi:hypothetical protein